MKNKIFLGSLLSLICWPTVAVLITVIFNYFFVFVLNINSSFWAFVIFLASLIVPVILTIIITRHFKIYWLWILLFNFLGLCGLVGVFFLLAWQSPHHTASGANLSTVRQIQSALEMYNNDKNVYPKSLDDLSPDYIGVITRRIYTTDRHCFKGVALLSYKLTSPQTFELVTCFEDPIGGYLAGVHKVTEQGIQE